MLGAKIGARQISGDDPFPLFLRQINHGRNHALHTGYVGQYVDPPELGECLLRHPVDLGRASNICLHKEGSSAVTLNRLSGLRAASVLHVGNDNRRSFASKAMTGCLPDSPAPSGNDGDFVFEFHDSSVVLKFGSTRVPRSKLSP